MKCDVATQNERYKLVMLLDVASVVRAAARSCLIEPIRGKTPARMTLTHKREDSIPRDLDLDVVPAFVV